jgi:hypothetical protein
MDPSNYEKYFLNNKNISFFQRKPEIIKSHKLEEVKDKLFWALFIAIKGETEFEYLKMLNKIKLTEKQMKIDFLEKINLQKKEITKKRLVKTIASVEANLMEEKTTLETLVVLSFIEGINILFVDEKTFFSVENVPEKQFHIIKKDEIVFGDIENFKKNKIERYRVNKILANISNYKLNELKEIYFKLNPVDTKITKQKLYDNIIELCSIKN